MAWPSTRSTGFIVTATAWNEIVNALSAWGGDVNAGGHDLGGVGVVTSSVKGHLFGTFGGDYITPAAADANIKLYSASGANWAGFGATGNGDVWIRTGLSGSPNARILIMAGGGTALIGPLGNTSSRPALTANPGPGELRGTSVNGVPGDDGYLRLSAGGGTSFATQQSFIDLSGYNASVPDMDNEILIGTRGVERVRISKDGNVGIGTATQFGSGVGVLAIHNRATAPTTNPTAGGVLYVESGALKYRGSSGTVTPLANA